MENLYCMTYGLASSSVVTLTQSQRDILCTKIDGKIYEGLLTTKGEEWKMRRNVLSPAFSSYKMKLVSLVQQPWAIHGNIYQTFNANHSGSTCVLIRVILHLSFRWSPLSRRAHYNLLGRSMQLQRKGKLWKQWSK